MRLWECPMKQPTAVGQDMRRRSAPRSRACGAGAIAARKSCCRQDIQREDAVPAAEPDERRQFKSRFFNTWHPTEAEELSEFRQGLQECLKFDDNVLRSLALGLVKIQQLRTPSEIQHFVDEQTTTL